VLRVGFRPLLTLQKNLGQWKFCGVRLLYQRCALCRVWFFSLLLRSCVSKLDSCSWYDSWLQKNYRLLVLVNSCHKSRRVQTMIKNHSCSDSWSNRKYPLLVLLQLKNVNSCRSRFLYSDSCTPLVQKVSSSQRRAELEKLTPLRTKQVNLQILNSDPTRAHLCHATCSSNIYRCMNKQTCKRSYLSREPDILYTMHLFLPVILLCIPFFSNSNPDLNPIRKCSRTSDPLRIRALLCFEHGMMGGVRKNWFRIHSGSFVRAHLWQALGRSAGTRLLRTRGRGSIFRDFVLTSFMGYP